MHLYGTAGGLMGLNEASVFPTRNFQDGQFEGAQKLSGQTMRESILIDEEGCYACTIRCKRVVKVSNERFQVNPDYGGPEYETLGAVGSLCGVDDLVVVDASDAVLVCHKSRAQDIRLIVRELERRGLDRLL